MDTRIALWTMVYNVIHVEMWDTEKQAAEVAVDMWLEGSGVVLGVQFADGRTVALSDWFLFKEELDRTEKALQESLRAHLASPKPEVRSVKCPFVTNRSAMTTDDIPDWVGEA